MRSIPSSPRFTRLVKGRFPPRPFTIVGGLAPGTRSVRVAAGDWLRAVPGEFLQQRPGSLLVVIVREHRCE